MPHHRQLVEAAFGRPVHERYGSRDVGYIAYQMDPAQSHDFDIDWADLLLEPETEGEESSILITKLHADGMPMIRYRIDDVGRFPEGESSRASDLYAARGRWTSDRWSVAARWSLDSWNRISSPDEGSSGPGIYVAPTPGLLSPT